MNLQDTIAAHRAALDALERRVSIPTVRPDITVREAWQQLAGLPECVLEFSVARYRHASEPCVEWKIWDGHTHHRSRVLSQAVESALAAHDSPVEVDLADVDRQLAVEVPA